PALPDIAWLTPAGDEMTDEAWESEASRSLQVFLNGADVLPGERGEPVLDDTFLIVFHADHEDRVFVLPDARFGGTWRRVFDTARGFVGEAGGERFEAGSQLPVIARSLYPF